MTDKKPEPGQDEGAAFDDRVEHWRRKGFPFDPEDRFDAVVVGVMRFIGAYAWPAAERVFKLISWSLLTGIVAALAFARDDTSLAVKIAVFGIAFLLLAAALATAFHFVSWVQEGFLVRLGKKKLSPWSDLIIRLGLTLALVAGCIQFLLPVGGELILILIEAGRNEQG